MGSMTRETSFEILDYFFKAGGNFIDTANNYQNEESELWLGEWMAQHKIRDQIVLATKYTTGYNTYDKSIKVHANYGGNHTKSLKLSVEASLKKLQTDYIDLLYVHWWDHTTSIPEMMQSLNQLVVAGKVLYLGASDTPAWVVAKANQYAQDHGLRGFSVYQGKYNAADRDPEREILPMLKHEGLAFCPWSALGGGKFKTAKQRADMEARGEKGRNQAMRPPSADDAKITDVLEKIADAKGKSITAIALRFVLDTQAYVFPIIGGRTVAHLKDNIEALSISLSDEEMKEIKGAIDFSVGFPLNFIGEHPSTNFLLNAVAVTDYLPEQGVIA